MFHVNDEKVRGFLFSGNFGLEKESLRITPEGFMAHTPHPFDKNHKHIVRDFCENQTEINTPVLPTAEEAVESLYSLSCEIQKKLAGLSEPELYGLSPILLILSMKMMYLLLILKAKMHQKLYTESIFLTDMEDTK